MGELVLIDTTTGVEIVRLDPVKAAAGEYDQIIKTLGLRAARSGQLPAKSVQPSPSQIAGSETGPGVSRAMRYPEAARHLGLTERTLRRRVAQGRIGCRRDGRCVIFLPEHIAEYERMNP